MCNGTGELQGVCLSALQCGERKGRPSGSCAAGFGVCCAFVAGSDTADGLTRLNQKVYL